MLDYTDVAKRLISNSDSIIDAIEAYVQKADEDLESELREAGYANAKDTVNHINDLEDQITEVLESQTEDIVAALKDSKKEQLRKKIESFIAADNVDFDIAELSEGMFEDMVPTLSMVYLQQSEGDLVIESIRQRTSYWIQSWSSQLGQLTKTNSHTSLSALIENAISSGDDIQSLERRIISSGWRSERYQARRIAITEVLRAHSVAREEAIQQSPATDRKEWRHTGGHKIKPRHNHIAMDKQIVPKDQPFTLIGKDGNTYYPMFPKDPILPAGESINCRCIHRGIVNDEVLGLPLEERQTLQAKAVEEADTKWESKKDSKASDNATIERPISHTNTAAAERWAKKYLGVNKTNYTKQDIKIVNKINRAMQRLYKEYPSLKGFINEIRFNNNMALNTPATASIGFTNGKVKTRINLNPLYFTNTKALNEAIEHNVKSGDWTPKRSLYGILKHEMVHMLSYKYSLENSDTFEMAREDIRASETKMAIEVKRKALEACNMEDDRDIIKKKIGRLASENADEFLAELVSCSKSSKLVKVVNELFNERVK